MTTYSLISEGICIGIGVLKEFFDTPKRDEGLEQVIGVLVQQDFFRGPHSQISQNWFKEPTHQVCQSPEIFLRALAPEFAVRARQEQLVSVKVFVTEILTSLMPKT